MVQINVFVYVRQRKHRREKLCPSHRKLKPSHLKAANPHLLLLLRRGQLMLVKPMPLGAREKDNFSGAPDSSMQFPLSSHQRATVTRSSSKRSKRQWSLTVSIQSAFILMLSMFFCWLYRPQKTWGQKRVCVLCLF